MGEKQTGKGGGCGQKRAADEHLPGVSVKELPERLTERQRAHAGKLRRLLERSPQYETEHATEAADDEGDSPAVHQLARRQERADRQADAGRHSHPARDAGEHDAADERRESRRRFHDVGERARQLAAQAESLHEPQQHHQHACRNAPLSVRRHQSHPERGARHHEHRPEEHPSPAEPIAVVAENDAADRTRQVAGRERGKRGHQRHDWRRARKDRLSDVAGKDAEDHEVVELERPAETGQQDDAPACGGHAVAD